MKVDLNPMPYMQALELIQWCFDRDIDRVQCFRIIDAMTRVPVPSDVEWTIDIPDKYMTYFALKWL